MSLIDSDLVSIKSAFEWAEFGSNGHRSSFRHLLVGATPAATYPRVPPLLPKPCHVTQYSNRRRLRS